MPLNLPAVPQTALNQQQIRASRFNNMLELGQLLSGVYDASQKRKLERDRFAVEEPYMKAQTAKLTTEGLKEEENRKVTEALKTRLGEVPTTELVRAPDWQSSLPGPYREPTAEKPRSLQDVFSEKTAIKAGAGADIKGDIELLKFLKGEPSNVFGGAGEGHWILDKQGQPKQLVPGVPKEEKNDISSNVSDRGYFLYKDGTESGVKASEKERREGSDGKTVETATGVYQWNPATKRYDIFVGEGKMSVKEAKEAKKEASRLDTAISKAELVMSKADEALGMVGYNTAGLGGAVMWKFPGSEAVDFDQTLETIRSHIGFNELAEMRAASPTGGALGQVAVKELELLSAALSSLNRNQSPSQLAKNLQAIKMHYANWKQKMAESQKGPEQFNTATTGNGPQVGSIEGGYRFKGGNPSNPTSWERL